MSDPRKSLIVPPGRSWSLADVDPGDTSLVGDKDKAKERLVQDAEAIAEWQEKLFAERRRALLVVLQGTDTSGKDGTVRGVFGRTGPMGLQITAFGRPSTEELAHDFLWRIHAACPRRGIIGVFNRSHYEDVLVGRVRKLADAETIERRFGQILAFEEMLASSTTIVKIMLHISKDEQRERLQARLDDPEKTWKFDPGDIEDRRHWDAYQDAYQDVLARTSTAAAPWYVVPADKKWARNALVAGIVRRTLEEMKPRFPKPDFDPAAIVVE